MSLNRNSGQTLKALGQCDIWHQDMPFDSLDGEGVLAGIHLDDDVRRVRRRWRRFDWRKPLSVRPVTKEGNDTGS
jgi:hypothetical protein